MVAWASIPKHIQLVAMTDPVGAMKLFLTRDTALPPYCSPEEEGAFISYLKEIIDRPPQEKDEILEYGDVKFNFTKHTLDIARRKITNISKRVITSPPLKKRTRAVLAYLCLVLMNLKKGRAPLLYDETIYMRYRKFFGKKEAGLLADEETRRKTRKGVIALLNYFGSTINLE